MPLVTDSLKSLAYTLIVCALVIAALVMGRDILMPLALATVIAFILAPAVNYCVAHGIPRGPSAGLAVLLSVVIIGALATAFSAQLISLTADLPKYKSNLLHKVHAITGPGSGEGSISRASAAIEAMEKELRRELSSKKSAPVAGAPATGGNPSADNQDRPQVVVTESRDDIPAIGKLGGALGVLAHAGLTVLFTFFLLMQYNDLRDRVIRIAGTENISVTSAALSEAGSRLSHLFTVQAALNLGFGAFVTLALAIIGVPSPALWGVATAVLRFVPYIGSFLAAIPPTLLAAGVEPGWGMMLATFGVFAIGEPIVGHVIEPMALGRVAGISPLALIISASFWTLLWGPVGLVLAAPLTMLIVVLGQFVPSLALASVLLGDQPVLTADEEFYHRLLAGDAASALTHIESVDSERPLAVSGDAIVLPALKLAARDHRAQRIDEQQVAQMRTTVDEVLDMLDAAPNADIDLTSDSGKASAIVIPARGIIDEIAAHFVARVLRTSVSPSVTAVDNASGLMALSAVRATLRDEKPAFLILVTVGGLEGTYLKLIQARALRDFPDSRLLTYSLSAGAILKEPRSSALNANAAASLTSLRDIAGIVASRTASSTTSETTAEKVHSASA